MDIVIADHGADNAAVFLAFSYVAFTNHIHEFISALFYVATSMISISIVVGDANNGTILNILHSVDLFNWF